MVSAANATRWASWSVPPTRTTASRPRGRSKLSDQRPPARPASDRRDGPDQEGGRAEPTRRSAASSGPSPPRDRQAAADEILGGALHDQFVVDVFQAGAGTSHNMNANEVLANRAVEIARETERHRTARCIRTTTSTWPSRRTTSSPPPSRLRRCARRDAAGRAARRAGRASAPRRKRSRTSSNPAARISRTPSRSGSARSSAATPLTMPRARTDAAGGASALPS